MRSDPFSEDGSAPAVPKPEPAAAKPKRGRKPKALKTAPASAGVEVSPRRTTFVFENPVEPLSVPLKTENLKLKTPNIIPIDFKTPAPERTVPIQQPAPAARSSAVIVPTWRKLLPL